MKNKTSYFGIKRLSILSMLAIAVFAFSSCEKDEGDPVVRDLNICKSVPVGSILCNSHVDLFTPTDPTFYASAVFDNIDENTLVSFTLSGEDSNGNLIELAKEQFRPSSIQDFDDDIRTFNLGKPFDKNPSIQWPIATYQVDAKIENGGTTMISRTFSVQ